MLAAFAVECAGLRGKPLTPEEEAVIEMKLALARALRFSREASKLTQSAVAKKLGSSQSRVAKAKAGDPTVSFDLLMRALLAVGVPRSKLGRIIGTAKVERVPRRARRAELTELRG